MTKISFEEQLRIAREKVIDDYIFELIANKPKEYDMQTFRNYLFKIKDKPNPNQST